MFGTMFWEGIALGAIVGFILGFLTSSVFNNRGVKGEFVLAWAISVSWLVWHIGVGFGIFGVVSSPPAFFDIVAGGSVGFILGEKFFEYLTESLSKFIKK